MRKGRENEKEEVEGHRETDKIYRKQAEGGGEGERMKKKK